MVLFRPLCDSFLSDLLYISSTIPVVLAMVWFLSRLSACDGTVAII